MPTALIFDVCENIHLHIRDLLIEFSETEFLDFCSQLRAFEHGFREWRLKTPTWSEGTVADNVLTLGSYSGVASQSAFWSGRLAIEKNAGDCFHLHYHNYRIELDRSTFLCWMGAFRSVMDHFESQRSEPSSARAQS
jgi:hypothetical protein